MEHPASAIARDLAGQAERLCRRYLSNGRREGNYWQVGDVRNTPGRSLYVRLRDSPDGTGRAGKWTDAESGEHGDLLDIVRASTPTGTLADALAEARRFLSLPDPPVSAGMKTTRDNSTGSPGAARRLLAILQVDQWHAGRNLSAPPRHSSDARTGCPAFPPTMLVSPLDRRPRRRSVRNAGDDRHGDRYGREHHRCASHLADPGRFRQSHSRLSTSRDGSFARPRCPRWHCRSGHGCQRRHRVDASLYAAAPTLPSIAALSSAHLAALIFPSMLRRLYVAREADPAGRNAFATLTRRARQLGIDVRPLDSQLGDLNTDLRTIGLDALRTGLLAQMQPEDRP